MPLPLRSETTSLQAAAPSLPAEASSVRIHHAHSVKTLTDTAWLARVENVHERVRAELPESQRSFLLPRSASYYQDLLSGKTGVLFGAFADNELVGSMALVWASSFADARKRNLLTCPDSPKRLKKKLGKGRVAIVQALGLRKVCLGRKLSCSLLRAAVETAGQAGCSHLFAQIAADNVMSWLRFMERDFAIVGTWVHGHRRFLLRWLTPEEKMRFLSRADSSQCVLFKKDYTHMPTMLARVTSSVQLGQIVFFNNLAYEPGVFNFVFA